MKGNTMTKRKIKKVSVKEIIQKAQKSDQFKQINKLKHQIAKQITQTREDKQKEFMILGFRKIEGVNISIFKEKYQENPLFLFRKELDKLVSEGLIEVDLNNIRLTNKGLDLANIVFEEFI